MPRRLRRRHVLALVLHPQDLDHQREEVQQVTDLYYWVLVCSDYGEGWLLQMGRPSCHKGASRLAWAVFGTVTGPASYCAMRVLGGDYGCGV